MARKARSDSTSEMTRIVSQSGRTIVCPEHIALEDGDKPFFTNIIAEFAFSEWTAHQLELAAMLARSLHDLHREQILLRQEGEIASSIRGTPCVNPRRSVVQMLAGTVLNFRRSLALNARAAPDYRDVMKGRRQSKQIEANAKKVDSSDLIARPS